MFQLYDRICTHPPPNKQPASDSMRWCYELLDSLDSLPSTSSATSELASELREVLSSPHLQVSAFVDILHVPYIR